MAVFKPKRIVAAVLVGMLALHVGPLLKTHSEQDACSFGDVSNEEYRSLLARAGLGFWRPLWWSDGGVTLQINRKYRELLPNSASTAMKVATAHAVLRASGAEFRRFDDEKSPITDAKIQRMFRYQYLLDINRLFYFAPFLRSMWIILSVDDPLQTASQPTGASDFRITAYLPNLIEGVPKLDRNSEASVCPPIPQV